MHCNKLHSVSLCQGCNDRGSLTSSRGCGQGALCRLDVDVVATVGEEVVEGEGGGGRERDRGVGTCLLTPVGDTQFLIQIALGLHRAGGREGERKFC